MWLLLLLWPYPDGVPKRTNNVEVSIYNVCYGTHSIVSRVTFDINGLERSVKSDTIKRDVANTGAQNPLRRWRYRANATPNSSNNGNIADIHILSARSLDPYG